MSSTKDNTKSICANCGKEGSKLKSCTACKLVKYCNRECQIAHRPQHKKVCKKRAAELHDEKLFKQPPPELDDCPICFLRLPCLDTGRKYMSCCGKTICSGCDCAPRYDNQGNKVDINKQNECPFCRVVAPKSEEEARKRIKLRVDMKDARAIFNGGCYYSEGLNGFPQDYAKALELLHQAGELGQATAYNIIGYAYSNGQGVEVDEKKAEYYYQLAAIGGCTQARHNLGIREDNVGNFDRALRHYMIAVRNGFNESLKEIKDLYSNGFASKDNYMKALQLYQEYLGEIKSDKRDKAAAAHESCQYY